ncbi:hypothetical protein HK100_008522, partial [Physocladia obscura]
MDFPAFETAEQISPTSNSPLKTTEAESAVIFKSATANNDNNNMFWLSQATLVTTTQTDTALTIITAISTKLTTWPVPAGWPNGFMWPLPKLPATFNGTFSVTAPVPRNWPAGYPWPPNTNMWPPGTTQLTTLSSASTEALVKTATVATDGGASYGVAFGGNLVGPVVGVAIGVLAALVVACVAMGVCWRRMRVVRMRKDGNDGDGEALNESQGVGAPRSASLLPIVSRSLRRAAGSTTALRLPTTEFVIAALLETTIANSNTHGGGSGVAGKTSGSSANKKRGAMARSVSPVPPVPPLPHWRTVQGFPFPPLDYALPSNFDGSFAIGSPVPRNWPIGYSWPPGSGLYPPGTSPFVPSSFLQTTLTTATQTELLRQTTANMATIQQDQTTTNSNVQVQTDNIILAIAVGILAALLATTVGVLVYRRRKMNHWNSKTSRNLFGSNLYASPHALYSNGNGSIYGDNNYHNNNYQNNNNECTFFGGGNGARAMSTRTGGASIKAPSVSQRSFFMGDTGVQSSGTDNEDSVPSPEFMIAALLANSTADCFTRPRMMNGSNAGSGDMM